MIPGAFCDNLLARAVQSGRAAWRISATGPMAQAEFASVWISSLVLTIERPETDLLPLVDAIGTIAGLTAGQPVANRLPVVIEAIDGSTSRHWHDWLQNLPGVSHIEVALVTFDAEEAIELEPCDRFIDGTASPTLFSIQGIQ